MYQKQIFKRYVQLLAVVRSKIEDALLYNPMTRVTSEHDGSLSP